MNKKEVLEIRKLLNKDDCRIQQICGCYVDGHKDTLLKMKEAFLSLPDEEMFKYTELLKKTLSGSVGKNLLNLEFPLAEEAEGGHQKELMALRDSQLKDESLTDAFFEKIISTYLYAENYLILLVSGTYDIPGRSSNKEEMFDTSDYVYSFLLCCICPVTLSRPGLIYDARNNIFTDKNQDWMVQNPEAGFLFPAFNDRNTDIHNLLYYTKNPDILHPELTGDLLGCELPMPASEQKDTFNSVIEDTFQEKCSLELAKTVHEKMNALLEGKKEEPEPTPLEKTELKHFLASCGADEDQIRDFEENTDDDKLDSLCLLASNLANTKKFEIKSPDIKISISAERTDLIETRILDGQEYLVIPVTDTVTVNGIRIRSTGHAEEN